MRWTITTDTRCRFQEDHQNEEAVTVQTDDRITTFQCLEPLITSIHTVVMQSIVLLTSTTSCRSSSWLDSDPFSFQSLAHFSQQWSLQEVSVDVVDERHAVSEKIQSCLTNWTAFGIRLKNHLSSSPKISPSHHPVSTIWNLIGNAWPATSCCWLNYLSDESKYTKPLCEISIRFLQTKWFS